MQISTYKTFTYLIVIITYTVVIYKLITYDEYTLLIQHLTSNTTKHWIFLFGAIILMPFNILAESIKWKYAIHHIEKISLKKAIISTLKGQVGAIATPNKLGDFPTRALSLQYGNKSIATIMGFISAWTLTLVITTIGISASIIYISKYYTSLLSNQYLIISSTICLIILISIFSLPTIAKKININNTNIKKGLFFLSKITKKELLTLTLLSLLRYIIFCTQLTLMFLFFDINISLSQASISIPIIYLLTTITPTIIISEATTRSSYAILILTPLGYSTTPTIILATTLLWTLNCMIPAITGSILFNKKYLKI